MNWENSDLNNHHENDAPVRAPIYRYPDKAKEIGHCATDIGLRHQPGCPIILVNNPHGEKQLCFDYRRVKTQFSMDMYPLPKFEGLVKKAARQEYYASLHINIAYFQNKLDETTTFADSFSINRFR